VLAAEGMPRRVSSIDQDLTVQQEVLRKAGVQAIFDRKALDKVLHTPERSGKELFIRDLSLEDAHRLKDESRSGALVRVAVIARRRCPH
jgi:hypothetical protein